MSAVKTFNGLNGRVVTRIEIEKLIADASEQNQFHLVRRLEAVLSAYDDAAFTFEVPIHEIEAAPQYIIDCVDCAPETSPDDSPGLAKAVSPTEIYDMITNKVIEALEKPLDFKMSWGSFEDTDGGYLVAYNFDSKKQYRGINAVMLNSFRVYDPTAPLLQNPYYLTFKQIEAHKGKLLKGSKGQQVIYFTNLFKLELADSDIYFTSYDIKKVKAFATLKGINHQLIDTIPILKYYNVFNGKDVEGIDFDLDNFKGKGKLAPKTKTDNKELNEIPVAEAIIEAYPKPAPKIKFGGDDALYNRLGDFILIPKMQQFDYIQAFYTTIFHELIHSTGSPSRLDRVKGKRFGDKDYSFEELIAELGASFLCAEAGMLHYTFRNSAAYIKGWRSVLLTYIKEDNKFFFRASSQAQKAVDFMLDRNDDGVAAYEKLVKQESIKVVKEKKPRAQTKPKTIIQEKHIGFAAVDPISGEIVASKKTLPELLTAIKTLEKNPAFKDLAALVYEVLSAKGKNVLGKQIKIEKTVAEVKPKTTTAKKKPVTRKPNKPTTDVKIKDGQYALFGNAKGLKSAIIEVVEPEIISDPAHTESTAVENEIAQPIATVSKCDVMVKTLSNNPKVVRIGEAGNGTPSQFFTVAGEVGKFLQAVEKKPVHSVVITLDGEQGAGKTTAMYKFMDAFARPGNKCLFISAEEHPQSDLATSKAKKYLSPDAINNIDTIGEVETADELYSLIDPYDIIFIDSWQKLQRMVGAIRLDEDLRKRFNGKVFVIIFQQTTTGRTKGGAEVVFDGDIITKMVKAASFADNYAYFDKNRYTKIPLETIRYNIATGKTYNPMAPEPAKEILVADSPLNLSFKITEKSV